MRARHYACLVACVGVAAWAATYHLALGDTSRPILVGLYLFNAALISFYIASVWSNDKWMRLAPAYGRVVAIVPAFNEEPHLLRAAIEALLRQTYYITEIHVMDDGSTTPQRLDMNNRRIVWHRQENGGKRKAQAGVLEKLKAEEWDYILTVDSDSVPADNAVECLMRAMSKPEVQAATGLILTRNWSDNWLTRLSDVNIGTSCLMIRSSRSTLGAVETTSGALAMYRAGVVFDNLPDYVKSGTNGDDRRLTMYSLLRGDVVVVNEAVVHSAMPDTVKGLFLQRLRWGKSSWQALPFAVTNLEWKKLAFPLLAVAQWLMLPILGAMSATGILFRGQGTVLWMTFGSYLLIRYAETGQYILARPGMSKWTRLWTWLVMTPLEILVKAAVIYPAKYWAITKLKQRGWHTRGNAHATKSNLWNRKNRLTVACFFTGAAFMATVWLLASQETMYGYVGAVAVAVGALVAPWKPAAEEPTGPGGRHRRTTEERTEEATQEVSLAEVYLNKVAEDPTMPTLGDRIF